MAQIKSNRRIQTTAPSKNTEVQKIVNTKSDEPNFYVCPTCEGHYSKLDGNFPASQSESYSGWNYHIPICRKCLDKLFLHYTNVYGGNEDKAIRRICERYDIYYNVSLLSASRKITKARSRIHNYISKANLTQYRDKTYDTTLDEERNDVISSVDDFNEKKLAGEISTTRIALKRWGIGVFDDAEYVILEEHYKMLKDNNPNADNNQEIFIKSLCHLNLLMTKALKEKDLDGYTKANGEYSKTFTKAGLKTIEEKDGSADECLGVTLASIAQFTPEEYYKDKKLYNDFDEFATYFDRFVKRPLKNLMFGSNQRDEEYYVKDTGDLDE